MNRPGHDNSGVGLVAQIEEVVRNELVQQRIILDLGLSIIDIQAITKEVVASLLSMFTVEVREA